MLKLFKLQNLLLKKKISIVNYLGKTWAWMFPKRVKSIEGLLQLGLFNIFSIIEKGIDKSDNKSGERFIFNGAIIIFDSPSMK